MKSCFFRVLLFVLSLSLAKGLSAQDGKYWVTFTDKLEVAFDPHEYFHPRAIERRIKNGVAICDSSDFPVSEKYLKKVKEAGAEIKLTSRWLNAACCFLSQEELTSISQYPFVESIEQMADGDTQRVLCNFEEQTDTLENLTEKQLLPQVDVLGGSYFQKRQTAGKGVRIAVFDAGFRKADQRENLRHLFENSQIELTRDFCRSDNSVFHHSTHGTDVLTCIAGKTESVLFGLATDATFLLARTEYNLREPLSEEENWLAAAEWADRHGADIISSSLGYSGKRYFQDEMDGKTSLVARAANAAFDKGILVVNSMGNEALGYWEYLVTPADAAGVLAVGGILQENGIHIDFSSFGPTQDNRMKPNVCAFGSVITEINEVKGKQNRTFGTSFSAPLITGFAACVLQSFPNWDAEKLFLEIEKSGRLYPYFDYAHGFGMPHARYFFDRKNDREESYDFAWAQLSDGKVTFELKGLETRLHGDSLSNKLFFHLEDIEGKLVSYAVYEIEKGQSLTVTLKENVKLLRAWWAGNFIEIELP